MNEQSPGHVDDIRRSSPKPKPVTYFTSMTAAVKLFKLEISDVDGSPNRAFEECVMLPPEVALLQVSVDPMQSF
ncbi:hypothetical protein T265_07595 [Opisthorchis viverrini]|uniref:Uncharacterized protein n=1 Tax=Opisthorchis viverrini TaxID=6198 RepID=A0A074ZCC2_OPIVI|nr:hypothetical protein T265_07595 [Opisthorchis viverrini]KER24808.1 hypothetical protein T265_07595 [Opisthorchis viverrini]